MSTETQLLKFAQAHDWGYEAFTAQGPNGAWGIMVGEVVFAPDGDVIHNEVFFDNMKDLRAWAGY